MQLREAIRQLTGTQLNDITHTAVAEVTAVDLDNTICTCQLIGSNATSELLTVSLMAEGADGWLLIPVIGSTVIVVWSTRMLPFVAMFSDIQDAYLSAEGSIVLNNGTYGGLVKVSQLIEKLNNLENAFNLLNAKVNALAPTPVIPNLVPTEKSELENTNIKHG